MTSLPAHGVLMLDPGVTTGVARYGPGEIFSSIQLGIPEIFWHLNDLCSSCGPGLAVGWERFDITPYTHRLSGSRTAMEVIGAARAIATLHHCAILPESPRDARKALPRNALKLVGWHRPSQPHANDAASHLLNFLLRSGNLNDETRGILFSQLGQ